MAQFSYLAIWVHQFLYQNKPQYMEYSKFLFFVFFSPYPRELSLSQILLFPAQKASGQALQVARVVVLSM